MRSFAIVLITLWATAHAFTPLMPISHSTAHVHHALWAAKNQDGEEQEKRPFGQRIKRVGKGLKRSVASLAFASLAFRQPHGAEAAPSAKPIAFAPAAEQTESQRVVPVATAVVAAAGVGTAAAKYIIKRGEDKDSDEISSVIPATKKQSIDFAGSKDSLSASKEDTSKIEETSKVDSAEDESKKKEQQLIMNVLEKVKDAEKKALKAKMIPTVPDNDLEVSPEKKGGGVAILVREEENEESTVEVKVQPVRSPRTKLEAKRKLAVVATKERKNERIEVTEREPEVKKEQITVATKEPEAEKEPAPIAVLEPEVEKEPASVATLETLPVLEDDSAGFSAVEKSKIANDVFECHGFFPDLRSESELSSEVRKMRQQKSPQELVILKQKYDAIPDQSERVYTMLVDLGMMESYDHLEEYTNDFDDYAM